MGILEAAGSLAEDSLVVGTLVEAVDSHRSAVVHHIAVQGSTTS